MLEGSHRDLRRAGLGPGCVGPGRGGRVRDVVIDRVLRCGVRAGAGLERARGEARRGGRPAGHRADLVVGYRERGQVDVAGVLDQIRYRICSPAEIGVVSPFAALADFARSPQEPLIAGTVTVAGEDVGLWIPWVSMPVAVAVSLTPPLSTSTCVTGCGSSACTSRPAGREAWCRRCRTRHVAGRRFRQATEMRVTFPVFVTAYAYEIRSPTWTAGSGLAAGSTATVFVDRHRRSWRDRRDGRPSTPPTARLWRRVSTPVALADVGDAACVDVGLGDRVRAVGGAGLESRRARARECGRRAGDVAGRRVVDGPPEVSVTLPVFVTCRSTGSCPPP